MKLTMEDMRDISEHEPKILAKFADHLGLTIGMLIEAIQKRKITKEQLEEFRG